MFEMSETLKKISLSSMRKRLPKSYPRIKGGKWNGCKIFFLPQDLRVWRGQDTDFSKRSFYHHRMILKLLLQGAVTTNIEGVCYKMSEGEAVLYFPHQAHSTDKNAGTQIEYLAISFVPGLGSCENLAALRNRIFRPEPARILYITELIHHGEMNHAVYELGFLLAELAGQTDINIPTGNLQFHEITDYIRVHCMDYISVKTIADHFQMSSQTIRRIFRQNMKGCSPGKILREQRLVRAGEMLKHTTLSLSEIAERCRFSCAYSFSRAFKNMMGVPPGAFRNER